MNKTGVPSWEARWPQQVHWAGPMQTPSQWPWLAPVNLTAVLSQEVDEQNGGDSHAVAALLHEARGAIIAARGVSFCTSVLHGSAKEQVSAAAFLCGNRALLAICSCRVAAAASAMIMHNVLQSPAQPSAMHSLLGAADSH